MQPDLHSVRARILGGAASADSEIDKAIEISRSPACERVFTRTLFDEARAEAAAAQQQQRLAGLAVTVKDLFDIAGQTTAAGSVVLSHARAAKIDSTAVARLRAAGAAITGRTNMTEFAFSGVGVNPHHGTPANACDSRVPRIPGGSSSGGAVSVVTGAAFIALGSDTGGSLRIPAALNGIVGFKSTARLVPKDGALPLSTTLDTVGAMTRSVRDAITVHEILSARRVTADSTAGSTPLSAWRLAVVQNMFLDAIEPAVAHAFERTVAEMRAAGAQIQEITLPALDDLASINATGGFSAAESYAWHRLLLERSGAGYDPRVAQRIVRGATMKAHEYIDLCHARTRWIAKMENTLAPFDAVLSPTVPIVAPPIADVAPGAERDDAFFRVNALLLRNPSVVNMLDGCALSIPCHAEGELPVGLMIWHAALHDDAVLAVGMQAEQLLSK